MTGIARRLAGPAAAMLLGVAIFLAVFGWWVLRPTNIAWLDTGDRAMHQLGWMFYRDTPWSWPPGLSPRLGLELSTSISLVDGLPLVAMPLKLLAPLLPQPFQYWGWWLLCCYVLQSLFAYGIARRLGAGTMVAIAAAGFVLITPAFLFRGPLHMALSSHWVILAALWIYMRPSAPRLWVWPLLAATTAAIHATLLAMVLGIWGASLLQRLWLRRIRLIDAIGEVALLVLAVLATLWLVGFFAAGGDYGSFGYGWYKLNLLWPVISHGWSRLMPDLAHTKYDYEGMAFLGIGILGLLVVALLTGAVARLTRLFTPRWLPLTFVMLGMVLFAVSKTPAIGAWDIGTIPMPAFIETLGNAFRSTGRFVWPLLYLVTIGTVVLIARRLPEHFALPLIGLAFAVQTVDTGPRAGDFISAMPLPASVWETELRSPFWDAAAERITRVRHIPVKSPGADWLPLGYYAVTHGLAIDTAYLARVDLDALRALRDRATNTLLMGGFESGTLYVLDQSAAFRALRHVGPNDLLARVDGRFVFLRDGADLGRRFDLPPAFWATAD